MGLGGPTEIRFLFAADQGKTVDLGCLELASYAPEIVDFYSCFTEICLLHMGKIRFLGCIFIESITID
jgi:hypothetical protein